MWRLPPLRARECTERVAGEGAYRLQGQTLDLFDCRSAPGMDPRDGGENLGEVGTLKKSGILCTVVL